MTTTDRFSVHAWGGERGEECISCGVTWDDCDNFCDAEKFCPDCFAGMTSSEHHEKCDDEDGAGSGLRTLSPTALNPAGSTLSSPECTPPGLPPVVGYVIAERHVYGVRIGELDIDWDGRVHENLADAQYELAIANAPSSEDQTQEPSDHWKLYELREVGS